ncbi:MAG TPA: hypothetical protein VMT45_04075 [Thermoanaerobaculaceae bacterium]|nr:hypothetical protein [Thermoanaerobaculaceae bacterium]
MASRGSLVAGGGLVLLAACAITRTGTLTKLPTGPKIPVTVAVTDMDATLTGTDAQTGEEFKGTFHVVETRGDRGMLGPNSPMGGGSMTPGLPPEPRTGTKETIEMAGRLNGSNGTSLQCVIQVERTLTLKGSGTCMLADSTDLNPVYKIRF